MKWLLTPFHPHEHAGNNMGGRGGWQGGKTLPESYIAVGQSRALSHFFSSFEHAGHYFWFRHGQCSKNVHIAHWGLWLHYAARVATHNIWYLHDGAAVWACAPVWRLIYASTWCRKAWSCASCPTDSHQNQIAHFKGLSTSWIRSDVCKVI